MEIVIHGAHVAVPERTKEAVVKRITTALDRFEDHITRVHVTLGDINGPKGGVDKTCRIEIHGRDFSPIVSEETDSSFMPAINLAVSKLKIAVARVIEKLHDKRVHIMQSRGLKRKALDRAADGPPADAPKKPKVKTKATRKK